MAQSQREDSNLSLSRTDDLRQASPQAGRHLGVRQSPSEGKRSGRPNAEVLLFMGPLGGAEIMHRQYVFPT